MTDIDALKIAETALGENIVWITDLVDQLIRQKDQATLARIGQLDHAWRVVARQIAGR